MAEYLIKDTTLTAIANVIREKTNTTDLIPVSEIADKISLMNIEKTLPVLDENFPKDISVIQADDANATFTVVISNAGFPDKYEYQWYVDNQPIENANLNTFTFNNLSEEKTYIIYCIITSEAGSVTSRSASLNVTSCTPVYTYDGDSELMKDGTNWELTFKTGGTLNFSNLGNGVNGIEAFLVGGGGKGGSGAGGGSGGGGGGGGDTKTTNIDLDINTDYTIAIGGGSGNTTAFGITVNCGSNGNAGKSGGWAGGGSGGSGTGSGGAGGGSGGFTAGAGYGVGSDGSSGGDGVYAFSDSTYDTKFGAGGGGGGGTRSSGGAGGITGGGRGGNNSWGTTNGGAGGAGVAGVTNTGSGGGGGGGGTGGGSGSGAAGGSGIVIIRNKRG